MLEVTAWLGVRLGVRTQYIPYSNYLMLTFFLYSNKCFNIIGSRFGEPAKSRSDYVKHISGLLQLHASSTRVKIEFSGTESIDEEDVIPVLENHPLSLVHHHAFQSLHFF